jgi:hypothetical protein
MSAAGKAKARSARRRAIAGGRHAIDYITLLNQGGRS